MATSPALANMAAMGLHEAPALSERELCALDFTHMIRLTSTHASA